MRCVHGLDEDSCEICRVLGTDPASPSAPSTPERRSWPRPTFRAGTRIGLGLTAVAGVVLLVVLAQAVALAWAVVRVLEVVVVAAVAGWIGWKLGVAYGRRSPS